MINGAVLIKDIWHLFDACITIRLEERDYRLTEELMAIVANKRVLKIIIGDNEALLEVE